MEYFTLGARLFSHELEYNVRFGRLGDVDSVEFFIIHINTIPERSFTHLTAQSHPVDSNATLRFNNIESLG
jgi:hypothetical protein